jgi:hypothetical protein
MPICAQCLHSINTRRPLSQSSLLNNTPSTPRLTSKPLRPGTSAAFPRRFYASKTLADEIIEEIQEQYATTKDEFEIATEETEKKSVYAADDRGAAQEELEKLKRLYNKALEGESAEEVKRRVGQRIRELDNAVEALEKSALED